MEMDDVIIEFAEKKRPELKDPIFIEGLPGVGNVGKLAAEHLIDELEAVKFADIYSRFFPPQVLVDDEGVINLVNNELYYYRVPEGSKEWSPEAGGGTGTKPIGAGRDLIFLVGDYQGLSSEGQYTLSSKMLDVASEMGVKTVFTLGGYGLGKMIATPNVLGAATNDDLIEQMKESGVLFKRGEPGSGIVGASGLLLGLGMLRGMEGVCLMGETSGYFVDPKSARAVLEILTSILNIKVDYTKLEEKAQQMEKLEDHLKEMESSVASPDQSGDDLHYIG
jgi:proteasome assembly chaperone (PAC2) family protein